ncbi:MULTISPECIES: hypothetical protein [Gordonia]|uniref:Uncharacterized protein n=1 Tax=Gordonia sihwensis NBRC 108236 TaxID=1223544 RepID=L7LLV2_9ACTN|nr:MULTISPECIES: hypothetical protein [Gordonia]AUH69677.1 hypothetical protein CXX93_16820 [Gordonia sp. YC-JH1]GAC62115.1 hypothetical protein GSI01S_29_00030 [Gordonia sihwensis NBRC 108236]
MQNPSITIIGETIAPIHVRRDRNTNHIIIKQSGISIRVDDETLDEIIDAVDNLDGFTNKADAE